MATVALETAHTSEPLPLATLVLAAVEGALLLARARRSAAPLRAVGRELAVLLRARVPAPRR